MNNTHKILIAFAVALIILPFGHAIAGPGFGSGIVDAGGGGAGGGAGGGGSAPLDGGLSLLVAAGVGYGIKKFKGRTKHSEAEIKKLDKYINK